MAQKEGKHPKAQTPKHAQPAVDTTESGPSRLHAPRDPHAVKPVVDTTESGPSRLYAPSAPHPVESGKSRLYAPKTSPGVESGKSRLQTSAFPHQPAGGKRPVAATHPSVGVDTTEAGPPRLVQFRR
jgi:hypothetical protein